MSRTTRISPHRAAASAGLRLGERVRQLRVAAGLTQTELAGDRCSKEYVSQIERGKTRPPRETIDWIAERLGVDAEFLANGVSADQRGRVEAALARGEALTEANRELEAIAEFEDVRSAVLATGLPELEVRALNGEAYARLREGEVREALELLNRSRSRNGPASRATSFGPRSSTGARGATGDSATFRPRARTSSARSSSPRVSTTRG